MALSQTFHSQTKQFVSEGIRLFLFLIFKFFFLHNEICISFYMHFIIREK